MTEEQKNEIKERDQRISAVMVGVAIVCIAIGYIGGNYAYDKAKQVELHETRLGVIENQQKTYGQAIITLNTTMPGFVEAVQELEVAVVKLQGQIQRGN